CEVVASCCDKTRVFIGLECVVVRLAPCFPQFHCPYCGSEFTHFYEVAYQAVPTGFKDGNNFVPFEYLRPKRPPSRDDAEPRTDFTPGDWDLMPWKPNRTKEHV